MSDITGRSSELRRTGLPSQAVATVHESYSFACMRCGYGWEQSYDIEHYVDGAGKEFVMYMVNGERVPSPLTRPTCLNCGGHVVRMLKAGRVSQDTTYTGPIPSLSPHAGSAPVTAKEPVAPESQEAQDPQEPQESHRWHLSDLMHPFKGHHRKQG